MTRDEYHVRRATHAPTSAPRARVDCPTCGGDGLRSVAVTVHGLPYTELVACECIAGTDRQPMIARARLANDAEHAALGTPYRLPIAPAAPPPRRDPLL